MAALVSLVLFALLSGAVVISSGARSSAPPSSPYASKVQRSRQIGTQSQIVGRMFSEQSAYDPNVRPPVRDFADHSAIVVITSIYINRVLWQKGSAKVDLYLRQQWQDSRLSYEVDPREGIHEVAVPTNHRVWQPDSFFVGTEEDDGHMQRRRVVVEPSGYVRSSEKKILTVNVDDVGSFPLSNRKSFTLKISSFNYPLDDVVYLWANSPPRVLPVEVSEELLDESAEYSFEDASAGDCVGNYSAGSYSCVSVSITFKGCASGGMLKILLPCILLTVVSWLHFWIHGSWSVPRTFSAAIPFFIFIAVLFLLPHPSRALLIWLAFCTVITFFSLVEYFLVICYGTHRRVRYTNGVLHPKTTTTTVVPESVVHHNQQQQYQPLDPHNAQHQQQLHNQQQQQHNNSYNNPESHKLVVTSNEPVYEVTTTEYNNKANCSGLDNKIDLISRIVFPCVFLIFTIIFFIFFSL